MVIGITGGIASGKTMVSNYLKKRGFPIVDADVLSREIIKPGGTVFKAVRKKFGKEIIDSNGALNRTELGKIIYNDERERRWLDQLTHPVIISLAKKKIALLSEKHTVIFLVAPLLFESGMDQLCDEVWVVHAEKNIRQKRLQDRDGIDALYAMKKIEAQMTEEERLLKADGVLVNDGDVVNLYAQIDEFLKK